MILYSPLPSVTAVRTFSINAPLAASTLTPATGTPAASRTTPTMLLREPCASARPDSRARHTKTTQPAHKTLARTISSSPGIPNGVPHLDVELGDERNALRNALARCTSLSNAYGREHIALS